MTNSKFETTLWATFLVVLLFATADTVWPVSAPPGFSRQILDRDGQFLHAYLSSDDKWRIYAPLNEVSPELIRALRIKEDRWFFIHPGVNPAAVVRAAINNVRKGYRTSGASTITMQTVRLLEPRPRSVGSKIVEMFRAMQLEWRYSKRDILSLYINLLPYGGNIEGIRAATLIYLDKYPEQLSLAEIAELSVIPNDPETLSYRRSSAKLRERRDALLHFYKKRNAFSKERIDEALQTDITGHRRALPQRAAHFSRRLRYMPGPGNLMTSLQSEVQAEAEALVDVYRKQLAHRSIHNLAVLVIDQHDRSVAAYVGSQNFQDARYAGQVDGIRALRSPGSTLKPLIYGLAYDYGIATPATVVTDLPVHYGSYQPENYDEQYRGPVTLEYALEHSLNIPAVKILETVTVDSLTHVLSRAGFGWIEQKRGELGLSLALGGCGVRLEELAGLYSALAAGGIYQPLTFCASAPERKEVRILSEAAAWMLTETLRKIERPDLPREAENARDLPSVAWKTGTSYGRRDAWSIGYNQHYTVAVWAGNFSGEGVPDLSGAGIATPLMLRLFQALRPDAGNQHQRAPETIDWRYVCTESGRPTAPFCEEEVLAPFIHGISPAEPCRHMTRIWTDSTRRYVYCPACIGDRKIIEAWYPDLPADLITYYRSENIPFRPIPPHFPGCTRLQPGIDPEIVHPTEEAVYFLDPSDSTGLMMRSRVAGDAERVFWYVDGVFLRSAGRDEPVFSWMEEGHREVTCTDDKGRSARVSFRIRHL